MKSDFQGHWRNEKGEPSSTAEWRKEEEKSEPCLDKRTAHKILKAGSFLGGRYEKEHIIDKLLYWG